MKRIGWFPLAGVLLMVHVSAGAPRPPSWSSGGPFGARVTHLSFDASTHTLYAGTFDSGIFKSTDGARSWSPLSNHSYGIVSALAADPSNQNVLLVAAVREDVSRTADGGRRWDKSKGIPGYIWRLVFDPRVRERVWAAGNEGVFSSADSGRTWRTALSTVKIGHAMTIVPDPAHSDRVWAGGDKGLFKSRDGGNTWTAMPAVGIHIRSVALDAKDPSFVVALGSDALFTSADAGETWTRVPTDQAGAIHSMLVDSGSPRRILILIRGDLASSGDNGRTWETVASARGVSSFDALLADPFEPRTFYASSRTGVLKSTDAGKTWQDANRGLTGLWVNAVALDPPRTIYAATRWGRFCSVDAGKSWKRIGESLHEVRGLAVDPESAFTFYSATPLDDQSLAGPHLLKSRYFYSSGVLRETEGEAPEQGYTCVVVDPRSPRTVWAGSVRGLRRSTDAGATWPSAGLENEEITSLAIDPRNSSVVYAASKNGGVFKTTDGGENWSSLSPDLKNKELTAVAVPAEEPATVYAASHGKGLFKSRDSGASWVPVLSLPYEWIRALLVAADGQSVTVGTNGKGIFASGDGGETWAPMNDGLTALSVTALAGDPASGLLVAGTTKGVFVRQGAVRAVPVETPAPVPTKAPAAAATVKSGSDDPIRRIEKEIAVLKWRRTMGDIRSLAISFEAYAVDHGLYPPSGDRDRLVADLTPTYIRSLPRLDGWENPFRVEISETRNGYRISSAGADGVFEKRPPLAATRTGSPGVTQKTGPGIGPSDDPGTDAVFENGNFIRWWSELPTPP
jgi:photosystem II stability/assembly factor-like uncharacterized protein